ncbi:MAG: MBOAT family O-acyltransferase [Bacteroidales bacterium]|jgi:D-alanyl-lipoteichoic acid acyltransferase DltB (MBOAT superfamily)
MPFNSIDFAVFLPIVFILYWFCVSKNLKLQNLLIVVSSFIFYAWWDWRFLILLSTSAFVDYNVAIQIEKNSDNKTKSNLYLSLSIVTNLGILFFFKYFNFFTENFIAAFQLLGYKFSPITLKIILPIGISFYTFKTLSYIIDVTRGKIKPASSIVDYFAYVSFFPQLIAGPIERATNLLPQFYSKRVFSYPLAVDGLKQILWGFFKKIVIADQSSEYVNIIFNHSANYTGSTLVLGAFLFSIQIYADFSGYSDMAIGTARLFGFNTRQNFAFPYFSRNIAEFWRSWHISLTSWLTDYVFTPLSIKWRNLGYAGTGVALFITFVLCGFWHGANWTFIIWGALNALYYVLFLLLKKGGKTTKIVAKGKIFPSWVEAGKMVVTFLLVMFAWIFFRADSISHAMNYISGIFSMTLFTAPFMFPKINILIIMIVLFFIFEWLGREQRYAIEYLGLKWPKFLRWSFYYLLVLIIGFFSGNGQNFIYFQF